MKSILLSAATVLVATASQADETNFHRLGYYTMTWIYCEPLGYTTTRPDTIDLTPTADFFHSLTPYQQDWFRGGLINAERNVEVMGQEEFCRQAELSHVVTK